MIELMDVEAVRAMIAPLWAKNREHILDRLAHVRSALASNAEPTDDERTDMHALVGTLGTYGWPDGSELVEKIRLHLVRRSEGIDLADDGGERAALMTQLNELIVTLSEV